MVGCSVTLCVEMCCYPELYQHVRYLYWLFSKLIEPGIRGEGREGRERGRRGVGAMETGPTLVAILQHSSMLLLICCMTLVMLCHDTCDVVP